MIAQNIKSIEGGIGSLTKAVGGLDAAIMKIGVHANKVFENVMKSVNTVGGQMKLGQGGSGNIMGSSLAAFSYTMPTTMAGGMGGGGGPVGPMTAAAAFGGLNPQQQMAAATTGYIYGRGAMVTGAVQMAMSPFAASYGATMDTAGIVQQAGQFFQLGRRSGVGNRAGIERATFSALQGGITGMGSMGNAAQILGAAGYTAGTTNYLGAMNQIRNAAISMGMTNEAAAAGLANLQSGQTAAAMYQYGITTMTPQGRMKTVGQIAGDIQRVFASGSPMTAEQINMSYQRGNLGQILQGLNLDSNSQQMIVQALVDRAQGKDPDRVSQQDLKRAGNDNPFNAMYRMNASQTEIQLRGERNALTGLDAAARTVEIFNQAMGDVIVSMQGFKSYLDGVSGTNAGKGIKAGASSFFSGAKKVIGGVMLAGGIASANPVMAAAGAGLLTIGGGGNPGFGASFGGPKGGGNPGFGSSASAVSAAYGAVDNSGIWSSTGGKHMGTDFAVPVGTPIYATKDGFVSSDTIDKDYGNAVLVEHPDGYQTLYAHLSKKDVSPGQAVLKGQQVGLSGKSGNTTGPALHYEVRKGKNNPVNPSELANASSPLLSVTGFMGDVVSSSGKSSSSSNLVASGSVSGSTSAAAGDMYQWLIQQGFSENGAFGIVSNLVSESGLRPTALGDGGTSYGIAQWHKGRWDNLNKFAKNAGLDPSSIEAQSQFLMHELSYKGYSDLVAMLKDPTVSKFDATKAFLRKFERPADQSDEAVQRRHDRGLSSLGAQGGGNPGFGASMPTLSAGSNNVYITVKFDQANESNVIQFANRVQEILSSKNNHKLAGGS